MSEKAVQEYLRPLQTHYGKAQGFCIYCGARANLSDEHIIPYFMAGAYVLPQSSCGRCSKITRGFENDIAYSSFFGFRRRLNVQSRTKRGPKKMEIWVPDEDGVERKRHVDFHEMPAVLVSWIFELPGLLAGRDPMAGISNFRLKIANISGLVKAAKRVSGRFRVKIDPVNHMRLAAKIAHGMLYFHETEPFEPLLENVILTGNFAEYYVGGEEVSENDKREIPQAPGLLHEVRIHWTQLTGDNVYQYAICEVKLFVGFGGPIFLVVAARRRRVESVLLLRLTEFLLPIGGSTERKIDPVVVEIEHLEHAAIPSP